MVVRIRVCVVRTRCDSAQCVHAHHARLDRSLLLLLFTPEFRESEAVKKKNTTDSVGTCYSWSFIVVCKLVRGCLR